MKKAYELSVLCDVDVALIMFSPSGKATLFSGNRRYLFLLLFCLFLSCIYVFEKIILKPNFLIYILWSVEEILDRYMNLPDSERGR